MVCVAGCGGPPAPNSPRAPNEPTWADQADAVRTGRSDTIRLDRTLVTDDELIEFDELRSNLRRVNLSRTEITDAGLARLCDMDQLVQLRVASPRVTDAGLAHVARLGNLRFLHLLDMPISDAGLENLYALENLESLYLDRTEVTDAGLTRLLEALPNVHLHIDEHHHPLDPRAADHDH